MDDRLLTEEERVRVHDEPPTAYQRWLAGWTPGTSRLDEDWWLLDSCRIENRLITDPRQVVQAGALRDLAVHYATLAEPGDR